MAEEFLGGLTREQLLNDSPGSQKDEYLRYEHKLAEETTGLGMVGDVATGIGHGALDAVDETIQFGVGILDTAVEKTGDMLGRDWDLVDDEKYRGEIIQFMPRPVTALGKIAEDLTQFGVGLVGAGKFRKGLQQSAKGMAKATTLDASKHTLKNKAGKTVSKALDYEKGGGLKRGAIRTGESATAALVVQDPYEDTLAEVMQQTPELANPVSEFLANKITDDEFTRRLKNVAEDVILSTAVEGLVRAVKGAKGVFKPSKEAEAAIAKQAAEADAGIQLKAFVDNLGDGDAKVQIQHVLNAHQANASVADYLRFLPKAELDTLIDKVAPELKDALANAKYLKESGEANNLQVPITPESIEQLFTGIYKQLGDTLEKGVNAKVAEKGDSWETLKGVKAKKPHVTLKPKGSPEQPKGQPKGAGEQPKGEPKPPKSNIDLDIPPSVIKQIKLDMEKLFIDLKDTDGKSLTAQYMAILKERTKGLSVKYYDSPEKEKEITEYLRYNVLHPILKEMRGTLSFTKVHENVVNKAAELSGMSVPDMNRLVAQYSDDVLDASYVLSVQEVKLSQVQTDVLKTITEWEKLPEGLLKTKLNVQLLSQVTQMAEMSNVASALESSFGRGLGQRRMMLKSVDDMVPMEMSAVLDTLGKDPTKSKELMGELVKNLKAASNDLVATTKIAREFGKYQGIEKFIASMTEMWRGALLMNFSTNITNMLSGIAESFIIPFERIIGSAPPWNMRSIDGKFQWDPQAKMAHDQAWLHMRNMREGFKHGFVAMNHAFKHEVQALDPFKGGMVELPGKSMTHHRKNAMLGKTADLTHQEMLRNSPFQMTASNWNLKDDSFAGKLVNNTGMGFRMSFRFLGAQDEWIKQTTYWASLKSKYQMSATRLVNSGEMTIKEAQDDVMKKMRNHFEDDGFTPKMGKDGNLATDDDALLMARDVTHTKEAWDDSIVQNMQRAVNTNPALGIFLPFIRTPMDLINKAYQRTPLLGLASKRMQKDWRLGEQDPNLKAQVIGRQMVGFGVVGMGYMAVMDGKLTGKGPDDPRANKIWRMTHQPNSIMVDGRWISYNKADPMGMLLGVLANGAEAARNQALTEGTDAGDVAQATILAVTATIGDKSSLRGIINLTTLFSDQVIGKDEATENILEDHVASWVPSILTQVSGAFQDTSYIKEADGFVEKLMRKSPWHQGALTDRYNWITGEREKIPTGNSWGIPVQAKSTDWMLQELGNLNHGFSGPTRSFSGIELSSAQFSEWSKLMGTVRLGGRTLTEALQAVMKSREYDYDPNRQYFQEMYGEDPLQVSLVKRVMRRYKAEAKRLLIQNNPNLTPQQEDFSDLFGGG